MTLRLNGSTSGYVEIDAPATAGSNTLVLPNGNGTNGQYLQTNGSGGLSWAGAGKILQVVDGSTTTAVTSTSTSYADSGLTVTITPASSSNKILVNVGFYAYFTRNSAEMGVKIKLVRTIGGSSTDLYASPGDGESYFYAAGIGGMSGRWRVPFVYLDSPATTSPVAYKIQFACSTTASSGTVIAQESSTRSVIAVMEVAA
jgi:hypothetical protein